MSALRQRMARLLAGWAARLAPALPETPVRRVRLARLATFGEGRYRSPLEVLAERGARPVAVLERECGMTAAEARLFLHETVAAVRPRWARRVAAQSPAPAGGASSSARVAARTGD